jgi:hypothetical protein
MDDIDTDLMDKLHDIRRNDENLELDLGGI